MKMQVVNPTVALVGYNKKPELYRVGSILEYTSKPNTHSSCERAHLVSVTGIIQSEDRINVHFMTPVGRGANVWVNDAGGPTCGASLAVPYFSTPDLNHGNCHDDSGTVHVTGSRDVHWGWIFKTSFEYHRHYEADQTMIVEISRQLPNGNEVSLALVRQQYYGSCPAVTDMLACQLRERVFITALEMCRELGRL